MIFYKSDRIKDFDFSSISFSKLLQREKGMQSKYGQTALINLCTFNASLFGNKYTKELVESESGRINNQG